MYVTAQTAGVGRVAKIGGAVTRLGGEHTQGNKLDHQGEGISAVPQILLVPE